MIPDGRLRPPGAGLDPFALDGLGLKSAHLPAAFFVRPRSRDWPHSCPLELPPNGPPAV